MDILEKTLEAQTKIEEKSKHIGKGRYGRVLKMSVKPTKDELTKTLKITTIGLIIIGGLGFLIYWLWVNVPPQITKLVGG